MAASGIGAERITLESLIMEMPTKMVGLPIDVSKVVITFLGAEDRERKPAASFTKKAMQLKDYTKHYEGFRTYLNQLVESLESLEDPSLSSVITNLKKLEGSFTRTYNLTIASAQTRLISVFKEAPKPAIAEMSSVPFPERLERSAAILQAFMIANEYTSRFDVSVFCVHNAAEGIAEHGTAEEILEFVDRLDSVLGKERASLTSEVMSNIYDELREQKRTDVAEQLIKRMIAVNNYSLALQGIKSLPSRKAKETLIEHLIAIAFEMGIENPTEVFTELWGYDLSFKVVEIVVQYFLRKGDFDLAIKIFHFQSSTCAALYTRECKLKLSTKIVDALCSHGLQRDALKFIAEVYPNPHDYICELEGDELVLKVAKSYVDAGQIEDALQIPRSRLFDTEQLHGYIASSFAKKGDIEAAEDYLQVFKEKFTRDHWLAKCMEIYQAGFAL